MIINLWLFFYLGLTATTLVITIYFAYQMNSFYTYAVGTKKMASRLTPFVGSLSLVAMGQGLMLLLNSTTPIPFLFQLLYILVLMIGMLWLSTLVLQMEEFIGSLSVAELLGRAYGVVTRRGVALLALLFCVAGLAIQVRLSNLFLEQLFGPYSKWILLTFLLLLGLHSLASGWQFVVLANFFQLLLILSAFPLIVWTLHYTALGYINWEQLWKPFSWVPFAIKGEENFWALWSHHVFFTTQPLLLLFSPHILQHAFIEKNLLKVRKIYFLAGCLLALLLLFFVSIQSYVYFLASQAGEGKNFLFIIQNNPIYFSRLLLTATCLLVIFTGSYSYLHTASTLIENDLFFNQASKKHPLWLARIGGVICLAVSAWIGSHSFINIYHLNCVQYLYLGAIPLFFVVTLYGFRTSRAVFMTGIATSILTTILLELYSSMVGAKQLGLFLSSGINAIFLFLFHEITQKRGGWSKKKINWSLLAYQQSYRQKIERFKEQLLQFSLRQLLDKNTPRTSIPYFLFSSYGLSFVVGLFYLLDPLHMTTPYLQYLLFIAVGLNVLLLLFCAFNLIESHRFLAGILWYLGLFYLFFVLVPAISLLSTKKEIVLTLFCCNILFASLMVNWKVLSLMIAGGALLGRQAIIYSLPYQEQGLYFKFLLQPQNFLLLFLCLVLMIIILQQKATLKKQKRKSQLFQHAYQSNRYASLSSEIVQLELGSSLKEKAAIPFTWAEQQLDSFPVRGGRGKKLESIKKALQKGNGYLNRLIQNLRGEKMDINLFDLNTLLIEWKELVEKTHSSLMVVISNRAKHLTVQIDKQRFFSLLNDLLTHLALEHKRSHAFVLYIDDTKLHYELPERTLFGLVFSLQPTKQSPPKTLTSYNFREHTSIFKAVRSRKSLLYRLLDVVYAHCGTVYRDSENSSWQIILPINLKILKPTIKRYKQAGAAPSFNEEDYAKAWRAECDFRAALNKRNYHFEQFEQAILFMKEHHAAKQRLSGEPFYLHLFQVAKKVSIYTTDEEAILAALLHDTVRDTLMTLLDIYLLFGKKVANLVDQVTKLNSGNRRYRLDKNQLDKKPWRKLNPLALLIKLCDRMHNLETLHSLPTIKQQRILEETKEVYLALATQSGWGKVKNTLEKILRKEQARAGNLKKE